MNLRDWQETRNKFLKDFESITGVDVLVSPMKRAQSTMSLALGEAFRKSANQTCAYLGEIKLARTLDETQVSELVKAVQENVPLEKLKERFGIDFLVDSTENRKALSNIDGILDKNVPSGEAPDPLNPSHDHGESNFNYAQRVLVGQVAMLLYASREGGLNAKGGRLQVDDIAKIIQDIPPPTKEQVAYIFQFQKHLKDPKNEPRPAYDEALIYRPLADALACLPEGSRIVAARHGNTPFSDAQYDHEGKKVGLLAGGNVDLPLTAKGEDTARTVGAMIKKFLKVDPRENTLVMFGHSQNHSLTECALLSCLRSADIQTDGSYKPDTPHVFEKTNGKMSVVCLTSKLVEDRRAQRKAAADNASVQKTQRASRRWKVISPS